MKLFAAFSLTLAAALSLSVPARCGEPERAADVLVLERTVTEYGLKPEAKGEAKGKEGGEEEPKPEIVKLSERHYTVKLAPGALRESCARTGEVTVIRLDLKLLWKLDVKSKTYRQLEFAKIQESTARIRERLKRRVPMIEDPGQKARVEKILGLTGEPARLKVERPGKKKRVAGEDCELYVVKLDGQPFFRAWIAKRSAPLADRRWLTLGGCLPEEIAAELAAIRGLLMEATFPLSKGGRLEITTRKLSEEQPAAGDFDDPAALGYKRLGGGKKSSPEAKKAGKNPR